MTANASIPPQTTPIAYDRGGNALPMLGDWWRYFKNVNRNVDTSIAGTVTTAAGSGLEGGGAVATGVSLSIAPNGVSNAMLRQSAGTSVVGRLAGSTGNVADIQAVQNRTVLQRRGDQLAFYPSLDVPSVECDALRIDQAPTAEVVVCTHTITINVNGVDYKIPIVAA